MAVPPLAASSCRYPASAGFFICGWLAKHEPGEAAPLGITWCTGKTRERMLQLHGRPVVAH